MILHKYLDKFGIENLRCLELKYNIPSKFNDPFEFLARPVNDWNSSNVKKKFKSKDFQNVVYPYLKSQGLVKNKKEFKVKLKQDTIAKKFIDGFDMNEIWKIIQNIKKNADKITRLTCFSSKLKCELDEILMWSHYTDKHSGFRFHFDSDLLVKKDETLIPVKYSKERSPLKLSLSPNDYNFNNQFKDLLITKSEAWSYESEYRLFVFPQNCENKSINNEIMFFVKFNPDSLIRIDLGLFCNKQEQVKEELKRKELNHISLFKATLNQQEYKLDYVQVK